MCGFRAYGTFRHKLSPHTIEGNDLKATDNPFHITKIGKEPLPRPPCAPQTIDGNRAQRAFHLEPKSLVAVEVPEHRMQQCSAAPCTGTAGIREPASKASSPLTLML